MLVDLTVQEVDYLLVGLGAMQAWGGQDIPMLKTVTEKLASIKRYENHKRIKIPSYGSNWTTQMGQFLCGVADEMNNTTEFSEFIAARLPDIARSWGDVGKLHAVESLLKSFIISHGLCGYDDLVVRLRLWRDLGKII